MTKDNRKKTNRRPAGKSRRKFFKAVRLILFPILCLLGIYIGLHIGYVQLGKGDPDDVLRWETWKHMYDLVFAEP